MDRRGFLKTTAGAGLTALIVSGSSFPEAVDLKQPPKGYLYGFFDVCCIRPDPANLKFILAKPAEKIWDKLDNIHAKAKELNAPLLSTTCLGIQRVEPNLSVQDTLKNEKANDKAFVSINASDEDVKYALTCHTIFLERKGYPSPQENVNRHAEDVFLNNTNAAKIVRELGNRHWFVFGRGFQYCGEAAALGLLALGKKVTVIEDMVIEAGGEWSQLKTFQKTKDYLQSLGAGFVNFDSIQFS
jgi:hypothetical protein